MQKSLINIPDTAELLWGHLYEHMDRTEEDLIYIMLDSDIAVDVGFYDKSKIKNPQSYFTLQVIDLRNHEGELKIIAWDNPLMIGRAITGKGIAKLLTRVCNEYSIGGTRYPAPTLPYYLYNPCHVCMAYRQFNIYQSIGYCSICNNKEPNSAAIRYCPYCITNTEHIIRSSHPYCRMCGQSRGLP